MLEQDSDDEALNLTVDSPENDHDDEEEEDHQSSHNEGENLINILPTPINGIIFF